MKTSTSFAPSKKGQLSLASQSMGPKNFLRKEFLTTDGKKNFPMFQGAFEFITCKIIHNGAQNPVMLSNFSLSIQLRQDEHSTRFPLFGTFHFHFLMIG